MRLMMRRWGAWISRLLFAMAGIVGCLVLLTQAGCANDTMVGKRIIQLDEAGQPAHITTWGVEVAGSWGDADAKASGTKSNPISEGFGDLMKHLGTITGGVFGNSQPPEIRVEVNGIEVPVATESGD